MTDKGKIKETTNSNNDANLLMSDEDINRFKTMYYTFNATPDTQMKVFNKGKIIKLENIIDLHQRINEKMENHQTVVNQVTVHISFNDGRNEKLSWPEFLRKNLNLSASTKTISINWDFYIKMPGYDTPQGHSLTVRLGSRLRPDEFFKIMMESKNDSEIHSMLADVVCRVDFVNVVMADELINRVEEWYESLENDHREGRLMKIVNKHSRKLSKLIESVFPIIAILIIYIFTKNHLNNHSVSGILNSSEQLSKLLLWSVTSIIFVLILQFIGRYIALLNYRKADSFIEPSHLLITSGDSNLRKDAEHKNKTLMREFLITFSASILTTVIFTVMGILI